jgi:predicted RNA methylase
MRIADDVLAALSTVECDGNALRLVGTLDRKLYLRVNDVLEAAGGKWNRKSKAHIFEGSAAEAIDAVIVAGEITTKKTLQQQFGYFPTPAPLAEQLVDLAEVEAGMDCLEPSAGRGAIAGPLRARGCRLLCVEVLPDNAAALREFAVTLEADFLTLDPADYVQFDRVVMNPPFAMQADIKHVMHARQFLRPGGILVSVMSAGVMFREDNRARTFREWIAFRGGSITPLPEQSFKESGTGVNTVVVKVTV